MESVDVVVIGAGVVGLACARALAMTGREVLVLEAAEATGTGTSSRNSEVVHAGLYYPQGSLKAVHCVQGRRLLHAYCTERGIGYRRCGKLLVATHIGQHDRLEAVMASGLANGVENLQMLDAQQAMALEPALHCTAALHSPESGIIDSHALMLSLQGDLERAGGLVVLQTPVERALVGDAAREATPHDPARIVVETGGALPSRLGARWLVNCAGIDAPAVAGRMSGFPAERVPRAYYAKGNYFSLVGRAPFVRLIYPMPEQAGLGVHLTLDLAGQARFGPDVEWVDAPHYDVDIARARGFYAEIRRYWPGLRDDSLIPAYAGIRPKIDPPGVPASDFIVAGPESHGVEGVIQLFGIESPGLTSSLSLASFVATCLRD